MEIIWSDHGFADVKEYIDIEKDLPKRKDYLYFIAGTTLSLWFENENIKEKIEKVLNKIENLKKLNPETTKKNHIPFEKKYGDSVYFIEKEKYFFPNFYQKSENEKFKAMHGYPDDEELDGFIILDLKKKGGEKKNLKIKDIFEILR